MDNLIKKNMHMKFFFSSYNLYKILKDNQICTIMVNALRQNLPKLFNDKHLKKEDFDVKK